MKKTKRWLALLLGVLFSGIISLAISASEVDQSNVKSVQSVLNYWGYNCGTPDGIAGGQTEQAVRQYQHDQGIEETGVITIDLVNRMIAGIPWNVFERRYNEAVEYWNANRSLTDAPAVAALHLDGSTEKYTPNSNLELVLNPNYTDKKTIGLINLGKSNGFDSTIAMVEGFCTFYAFDQWLEEPYDAVDIFDQLFSKGNSNYSTDGIKFSNYSFTGMMLVLGEYDNFSGSPVANSSSVEDNVKEDGSTPSTTVDDSRYTITETASFTAQAVGNYFSEGLIKIVIDDETGFIDETGEIIIDPQYSNAGDFEEGLAYVTRNKAERFINKKGETVVSPEWDSMWVSFSDGVVPVKKDGKWGYVDTKGDLVIDCKFESASSFGQGLAPVKFNGKWGYINKSGDFAIDPQYEYAYRFSDSGLAGVKQYGEIGFINTDGEMVVEPQFDEIYGSFKTGYQYVSRNGKKGIVDKDGNIIIKPQYYWIGNFDSELTWFQESEDSPNGFINKSGEVVFAPDNKYKSDFVEGFAIILTSEGRGLMDMDGNTIFTGDFDKITTVHEGLFVTQKGNEFKIYRIEEN